MAVPDSPLPLSGFPSEPLAARLARHLPQSPPQSSGHDDDHLASPAPLAPGGVTAAVLLPIVAWPEPALLFTRRADGLARHGGQVAFPGGRVEATDPSPLEAALRETAEETGIVPAQVALAGYLSRYRTGTGFDIQPVVGVLPPGLVLKPDPAEVAAIFEVPLAFFRDAANRRHESLAWNGQRRSFYIFRHGEHEIWGATAAIIVDLVARIDGMEA
jgi:8-oxo-dGTP pyrophosphatase MutT (NUDIX family)